jgi:hypothetical protein
VTVNRARTGTFRPGAATPPTTRQNVTPTNQRQASSFRVGELTRAATLDRADTKSNTGKPKETGKKDDESMFADDKEKISVKKDATNGPPDDEKDDDKNKADDAVGVQKSAGDADDFEPLHGDLTIDDDDSNANSTTPAPNDTGVPNTPSGVKAPSNA